ncbi:MAG: N-formylglutamate amidohydrolase [Bauldia sp.]|uniref:N-formylglutamate amidohydrolase n=1 Tax=Bauldia sp. TaxID=2575872 RepID=UPI001D9410A3|nr:N-formylglutamate amidohydrolase [Bauldia sp.]MCB1487442.1 N-formylglutamate amidohydrolase [Bauldia sp.]MCB1495281.1 N-formylglutamate amidohydrolase [Bauldia sp.]
MPTPNDPPATPAFEILSPDQQCVPLVFNSPHSGRVYPESFLAASRLDPWTIRCSEDTYVDELFASAVGQGAPLLRANFPRAWLDVNREPYELDPKMFSGRLPDFANVRSVRVAGGLGTIARIVSESEEIYDRPLDVAEALERIEAYYKPYHQALHDLVARTRSAFGLAVLVDCHSMPSATRGGAGRLRPDIVIGDRYGTSCAVELTDMAAQILTQLGYSVSRNKPYAGGHITEHYGRPCQGVHALQIEVKRCLYMDERSLEPTAGFEPLRKDLSIFVQGLAGAIGSGLLSLPDAAE